MKKIFLIALSLVFFSSPAYAATTTSIPYDSDNSPNYFTTPPTGFSSQTNPDLFVKGVAKGVYSAGFGSFNYIYGGDSSNPTAIQQSNDLYSTYYDHCESQTKLDEAFVDQNHQISSIAVTAPGGYICDNGAFTAMATIKITTTSLPSGFAGSTYSTPVAFTYAGTHTVAVAWTGLPDGITAQGPVNSIMTLSGTLKKAGTFPISLKITDQYDGAIATAQFSLLIMTNTYIPGQKISLAGATPISSSLTAGMNDVLFTSFIVTTGVKDITVNSLTVKGVLTQGSWTGNNTIKNIRICRLDTTVTAGFTCLGAIASLVPDAANPNIASGVIDLSSPIAIHSAFGNNLPLYIYADLGTTTSGKFALGIASMKYTEADTGFVGIYSADVLGYQQTVTLATVPKTSVAPTTPAPAAAIPTKVERHKRATLVKAPDGTVYFLGAEIRYPFPSAEVFLSWGNKFSNVINANAGDLAMPLGPIAEMKK